MILEISKPFWQEYEDVKWILPDSNAFNISLKEQQRVNCITTLYMFDQVKFLSWIKFLFIWLLNGILVMA